MQQATCLLIAALTLALWSILPSGAIAQVAETAAPGAGRSEPAKRPPSKEGAGKRVTIEAPGLTDGASIIHQLFTAAGVSYVLDQRMWDPSLRVSLSFVDVPFDTALSVIAEVLGVRFETRNGIYFIRPAPGPWAMGGPGMMPGPMMMPGGQPPSVFGPGGGGFGLGVPGATPSFGGGGGLFAEPPVNVPGIPSTPVPGDFAPPLAPAPGIGFGPVPPSPAAARTGPFVLPTPAPPGAPAGSARRSPVPPGRTGARPGSRGVVGRGSTSRRAPSSAGMMGPMGGVAMAPPGGMMSGYGPGGMAGGMMGPQGMPGMAGMGGMMGPGGGAGMMGHMGGMGMGMAPTEPVPVAGQTRSTFTCPHCKKKETIVHSDRTARGRWKYCPHCGKKVK